MVRGAQHPGERQVPAVRRHGNGDRVVSHPPAVPVRPSDLGSLADQAHVAVLAGLLFGVCDLDAVLDVEVRNASDLERDPGQLVGFSFGDAGGTGVPFANGATGAGIDAAPALKVGQLGRKVSATKALVPDLEGAWLCGGRHLLDAGLDDAGPVRSDLSRVQAIGLQPIPVLLVGLGCLAGRVTSQGVGDAVQVGLEGQLEPLLAVAVTGLETCQLTGQGQAWGRGLNGSSSDVAHGLDCHVATTQPVAQFTSQLGVASLLR